MQSATEPGIQAVDGIEHMPPDNRITISQSIPVVLSVMRK
jgi:hypothetical protein